jgi:hypothetical protein
VRVTDSEAWSLTSESNHPSQVRLGWKELTQTNTLAYSSPEIITAVKGFVLQTQRIFSKQDPRSVVRRDGTVFTTLLFLRNLQIGLIS